MKIQGMSIGIGAGISAVVIVAVFFVFGSTNTESQLQPIQVPSSKATQISMSVLVDNGSPIRGNPDAPITLVEFGDYQCFYCNKFFHDTEESILTNYVATNKVKIIFKDYPIIGSDSINAAHGTHCANDQELFWEYHDVLYENWGGENNGWASSQNLLKFAKNIGLDVEIWNKCMLEKNHQQLISLSSNDAKTLGLTGTPAFFVIGPTNHLTPISGAQPYSVFERVFESELAK